MNTKVELEMTLTLNGAEVDVKVSAIFYPGVGERCQEMWVNGKRDRASVGHHFFSEELRAFDDFVQALFSSSNGGWRLEGAGDVMLNELKSPSACWRLSTSPGADDRVRITKVTRKDGIKLDWDALSLACHEALEEAVRECACSEPDQDG